VVPEDVVDRDVREKEDEGVPDDEVADGVEDSAPPLRETSKGWGD
jgi:hypothetical protein